MLKDKKLFLLDIDGTIALGNKIIEGTMEFMEYVRSIGGKYIFITNNSTKSIGDYVAKFSKLGLVVDETNFITSSYATALYLKEKYKDKKIFVLGTMSFVKELREFGLNVIEELDQNIACAVVGYDNQLNYKKIENICELLVNGEIDYIATNPDLVCPVSFGYVPDCGALCEMLEHAIKRKPVFIGKPNKDIIDLCLEQTKFSREETLVIGDRLYTDIACGINAGVDTCIIFTGEATEEELVDSEFKPTFSFNTIKELYKALT